MSTFLPAMWAAFFIRVRPASRNAKPACMNITSTAATTTQSVFAAIRRSEVFRRPPPATCRCGCASRAAPASPRRAVAAVVAAARCVRDRHGHVGGELVRDDERQQCLRQGARLEDAAAGLVGDSALAPLPDR